MSTLFQLSMNALLRSALIALLFVTGATLLFACSDGFGPECERACCARAVHSRFFQRMVQRLKQVRFSVSGPLRARLHTATGRASEWHAWLPSAQPTLEASPLRI